MKQYKSHKVVEAAEIDHIERHDDRPDVAFVRDGSVLRDIALPPGFLDRDTPRPGDYLVRYQPDGYLSWSPRAVFEAGYTLVGSIDVETPPLVRGTPTAVEVTVSAPAGKRAEVTMMRGDNEDTAWTVTAGQSQTWACIGDEIITVREGRPHSTVEQVFDPS